MKKLRMTLATSMLLFLTAIVLQSCLDDWDDKYDTLFAVGTVKVIEGKDYYFSLDEGSKLYPSDTTYVHDYAVTDGQRAFIYFRELEEKLPGYEYNAQIKHIENILTKDIYSMPAEKADSIGDDNINATDLWITGEYLNIKYQFYHSNNEDKKHMLNLVINEASTGENDKPDYVNLEFRHNAYNDSQLTLGTGLASFKLDNIAEQLKEKKGLNIRVKSLYDGERFMTLIPDNMEQIKAHIAVSLDGHTATPDYELDWMPREVKELAAREYAAASCLLMGVNTYNYIFEHWGGWPHKSKRSFVVSHYDTNVTPDCGVEFLTEEPLQRIYELKQETDMLVVGGGKLLTSLIKAGLLDSLTIYTVPVMTGKGIGFIGETFGSHWKLSESRVLDNGVVCSTYLFGGSV